MSLMQKDDTEEFGGEKNRSWNDLPAEIIEKILDALSPSDLLKVSVLCKKVYQISQLPNLRKNIVLGIMPSKEVERGTFQETFQQSTRKFSNCFIGRRFRSMETLDKYFTIEMAACPNIFAKIEFLKLENAFLSHQILYLMLAQMPILKSLSIVDCNLEKASEEIDEKQLNSIRTIVNKLNCFEFMEFNNTNYEKLSQITDMLHNLEKFKIYILKAFDVGNIPNIICSIIENNKSTLRELIILNTFLLEPIFQIKDLNLENLEIFYRPHFKFRTPGLNTFLDAHKNLKSLKVVTKFNSNVKLELIAKNMEQLEELEWATNDYEDDNGVEHSVDDFNLSTILKFKKLKILKAYHIYSSNFSNLEPVIKNVLLKDLYIYGTDLTNTDVINISKVFPNLEVLVLGFCNLTNSGIQSIIKNLTNLKSLTLNNTGTYIFSLNITEWGLSGFDQTTQMQTGISIQKLSKLRVLKLGRIEKDISEDFFIQNFKFQQIQEVFINMKLDMKPIAHTIFKNCLNLQYLQNNEYKTKRSDLEC